MADEFDGCECFYSHELVMRRLLSLIRQGQSYCTDTECLDINAQAPRSMEGENFTMMTMFFLFAVILYFIRPSSFMRSLNSKPEQPPSAGGEGPGNGAPPAVN